MLTSIGNFSFDTENAVCFTGHRPDKLPGNGDLTHQGMKRMLSVLYLAISESIDEGKTVFITGMAEGIDIYAARFILELRVKHPELKLVCCIPFPGQSRNYSAENKYDYGILTGEAAAVVTLSPTYTRDCFAVRNRFMVDHSSKVIAVAGDMRSGTGQTIRYAEKKGIPVRKIDLIKNAELFK